MAGGWLHCATLMAHDRVVGGMTCADTLTEVEVMAPRQSEAIAPQRLEGTELERLATHSVADALRYFAGMQVKDYGGIGGLKTVNVRSMGSQHVGIYYNGIQLGNAQNGQIDLGQFSLDNVESITLYHGQKSAIFQTASDFAQAGSVYLRTRVPRFEAGQRQHLRARLRTGSSDLLQGSLLYERRLAEGLTLSANVEGLAASGKYHFRYRRRNYDGTLAYDTTATRHNGDVQALRGELMLNQTLDNGYWQFTAYDYLSERGIPGAIVNNVWRRGERQGDHNRFVQGQWQRDHSQRFSSRVQMKWARYDTHYINKDTTQLMVDNHYHQQEGYASTSHVLRLMEGWNVSLSYDVRWNHLTSDVAQQTSARRWSHLMALATSWERRGLKTQASLLRAEVRDRGGHVAAQRRQQGTWVPALFASYRCDSHWQINAFAKRSYRMPTFNDLYYAEIGNSQLRPEAANQYDLGVKYTGPAWLSVDIDAYHNTIHDKIIAYPKGQQFRWTMLNLGRVHIDGVDVSVLMEKGERKKVKGEIYYSLRLQYTYQQARDLTDRTMSYYGDQIPYVPCHSGSAVANLTWQRWDLCYSFIYTGQRWSQPENIRYNHLQPWYTSDISLQYRCSHWRVLLEVNNLLAQDYDVILNYPMPRRNFAISIVYDW